jgi:hypothetical protein
VSEAAGAVETLRFQAAVAQHLDDLRVLLALLLEGELALLVIVLVLAPTSVLASLRFLSACAFGSLVEAWRGSVAGYLLRSDVPFLCS